MTTEAERNHQLALTCKHEQALTNRYNWCEECGSYRPDNLDCIWIAPDYSKSHVVCCHPAVKFWCGYCGSYRFNSSTSIWAISKIACSGSNNPVASVEPVEPQPKQSSEKRLGSEPFTDKDRIKIWGWDVPISNDTARTLALDIQEKLDELFQLGDFDSEMSAYRLDAIVIELASIAFGGYLAGLARNAPVVSESKHYNESLITEPTVEPLVSSNDWETPCDWETIKADWEFRWRDSTQWHKASGGVGLQPNTGDFVWRKPKLVAQALVDSTPEPVELVEPVVIEPDQWRRVIVESPYGSDDPSIVARNETYLRACLRDCLERGESPYASYGLRTQPGVLADRDHVQRERGIGAGHAWHQAAVAFVVYIDHGMSEGMVEGLQSAIRLGRPIAFRMFLNGTDKPSVRVSSTFDINVDE